MADTHAAKRVRFEDALQDLEETVQRLESGELSLEDALAAFERGVGLVRVLNEKLAEVEQRVEVLMRDSQGRLSTRPLDPESE
ncbi:MAG: exodeoxyribonuclease VII small subunit [Deltaproteobacteria bacterium]|nr:exodeoxyribonuclease VII small subunit [Deltaproteobacteria bacterium]